MLTGLKLQHIGVTVRLVEAPRLDIGSISRKAVIANVKEIDEDLLGWVRQVYDLISRKLKFRYEQQLLRELTHTLLHTASSRQI